MAGKFGGSLRAFPYKTSLFLTGMFPSIDLAGACSIYNSEAGEKNERKPSRFFELCHKPALGKATAISAKWKAFARTELL